MSKNKRLPRGWSPVHFSDIISLEYGKSFPERTREPGPYAVYGSNGIVGRAHEYLLEESTIVVGRKGSAGEINYAEPKSWPIDTTYYVQIKNEKIRSLDFIYYLLKWFDPRRLVETTVKPGLNRDRVYDEVVPLPPYPVQERIVEILQKADEIRCKRQKAKEMADAILPATFISTFGDPGTNPKKLPRGKLGDICHPTSGGTPSKKNTKFWTRGTIPWVSPEDMKVPEIYDVPDKITQAALGRRSKALNGTVLIVVRGMILQHSAPVGLVRAPLTFNQDIKGLVPNDDVPGEFLFWMLRCSKERLLHLVTTASHGTKKIDTEQLLELDIFRPPASEMTWFASIHRQFFEAQDKRLGALDDAQATFASLLSEAFTGELTAEWEKVNAKEIETRTAFNERLPRLLVLALLAEHAKRAGPQATEVLVTALMKYAFLFQMEANGRRRLYQFVPYHYGPFAKELYADLEKLQTDGLVSVDNDTDEDKTRITLADLAKVGEALAEVPDDLKEDVATILDSYGDLDHKNLLKTVYDKYPAYAKKSRLRGGRKKRRGRKKATTRKPRG